VTDGVDPLHATTAARVQQAFILPSNAAEKPLAKHRRIVDQIIAYIQGPGEQPQHEHITAAEMDEILLQARRILFLNEMGVAKLKKKISKQIDNLIKLTQQGVDREAEPDLLEFIDLDE